MNAHALALAAGLIFSSLADAGTLNLAQLPLFTTTANSPLVMLNMARDHRLYYEAYNDYSDLDGDGKLDIGYQPASIDYYGYYDSYKCYTYSNGLFSPATSKADRETRAAATVIGHKKGVGNKTCAGQWSGDFLNYVTTARIDALRKVLYGGYRSTDTNTQTILERTFIPQDAHSWGKEYQSETRDGYKISDYAPLNDPDPGKYHIFANTTLIGVGSPPLMRVLSNTPFRVWEWLSIERPVAGSECAVGANVRSPCAPAAAANTSVLVPSVAFTNLLKTTWKNPSATAAFQYADSAAEFTDWIDNAQVATLANRLENQVAVSQVNCPNNSCDPAGSGGDKYVTQIKGKITAPTTGTYTFIVDGDDAVDVTIGTTVAAGWYGGHGFANNDSHSGTINLTAGQSYDIEFRHQEYQGGSGYLLKWIVPNTTPATMTDYTVRVEVCKTGFEEGNCASYGDGGTAQKPRGLLQHYGESNSMYFGLLSGSYTNNTQGGVMRKVVSSIRNEISATDGTFLCQPSDTTCTPGIIGTIDRLRVTSFDYGSHAYSCGWITTRPMNNGECRNWGNPLGEMVYETIRYFAGKASPTASFVSGVANLNDDGLALPLATTWGDPYGTASNDGRFPICAKPYVLAISDNYPSFDSDTIPGAPAGFLNGGFATDMPEISFVTLGDDLWNKELGGGTKQVFIGQSGNTFNSAPTLKDATSFASIRGLAPGEPTRQGSYSTSALAYYAHTNAFRPSASKLRLNFFSVALASPLPNIIIPIKRNGTAITQAVTLVPMGKSVGGAGISSAAGAFQPTNQIVDFYVESVTGQDGDATTCVAGGLCPKYVFRINYEDVEQGADHDMDAIVKYTVELFKDTDGQAKVKVTLNSDYAAGGIIQHMGYVISGTKNDGLFLEVRDVDTAAADDPVYGLDTGGAPLPVAKVRVFEADPAKTVATLLHDPLWYAAKFGGFTGNAFNTVTTTNPDGTTTTVASDAPWDSDGDGIPDNYFLVVNPLKLEQQLAKAFDKISKDSASSSSVASNSTSLRDGLRLYVGRFIPQVWSGELDAYSVDPRTGVLGGPLWQAQQQLKTTTVRNIVTYDPDSSTHGIPFQKGSMTSGGKLLTALASQPNGTVLASRTADDRIAFLRGGSADWTRKRPCADSKSTSSSCLENLLGDIISSSVRFVGTPSSPWLLQSISARSAYLSFRSTYAGRDGILYVGANDGMLHGFAASDGTEKLAYIPSEMYRKRPLGGSQQYRLSKLMQTDYGQSGNPHAYMVDGSPVTGEVCTGSCSSASNWKTMLVGGLNGGGQGIFALNVTDPSSLTESNAANLVMWEFNDWQDDNSNGVGDANSKYGLGYTYGKPVIAQICTERDATSLAFPPPCVDGKTKFAVILGNGYNNTESEEDRPAASATGHAILYVLDSADGKPIAKINTLAGSSGAPNGIADVTAVDLDNDGTVDIVYAGDLLGNMWRFDLIGSSPANWKVGYGTSAAPLPLYVAKDGSATPAQQPITSAPSVTEHPNGGLLVMFGTGKYIEAGVDPVSKGQQSFYGIWDNGVSQSTKTRSDLQQQTIHTSSTTTLDGSPLRTSTANAVSWSAKVGWYIDFPVPGTAGAPSERVVSNPVLLSGSTLFFTSIIPSDDPCDFGGTSFNYFVNPETGGRLNFAFLTGAPPVVEGGVQYYASSYQSKVGITTRGLPIGGVGATGYIYQSGSMQGGTYSSPGGANDTGGPTSCSRGEPNCVCNEQGCFKLPPPTSSNCGSGDSITCNRFAIPANRGRVSWREIAPE